MKNRIKQVLKEKNVTVSALSALIDITQPNMSSIITGKVNPSIDTLEKIANALNVPISELFKPESELYGLIQYKEKTYKIDSDQALQTLYDDYQAEKKSILEISTTN